MGLAENVDRYLQEMKVMQNAELARREADICRQALEMGADKIKAYEIVKMERDEALKKITDIETAALMILSHIVYDVWKPQSEAEASSIINQSAYLTLRGKAKEVMDTVIEERVQLALGKELDDKFQKESNKIADEIIIESFGAGSHSDEARNRIQQIRDRCTANAYAALRGPWKIRCNNCGNIHFYELEDSQIQTLVLKSILRAKCNQRGLIFFHNLMLEPNIYGCVELTLRGVIHMYLMAS